MKALLQQHLHEKHQAAEQKRYARNMAESLMAKAQIPDGRHLVAILGTGMEISNVEALTIWAEQMLPRIRTDELNAGECLEILTKQLEEKLFS